MLGGVADSLFAWGKVPVVVAVVVIALGLLECFLGYRIFKIQVAIVAFLGGFGVGSGLLFALVKIQWLSILAGIVLGALLGYISMKIYKVGVFLLVGFMVFSAVFAFTFIIWVALIAGIVAGIAGVLLTKTMIILSSSFGGAGIIAHGIGSLIWGMPEATPRWLLVLLVVVVGVFACVVQFKTTKKMTE